MSGVARQANQNIIFKSPGIRLPTIELPKFKGVIDEWLGFRDTFESLVHNNETITDIQKLFKGGFRGHSSSDYQVTRVFIRNLCHCMGNYAYTFQ